MEDLGELLGLRGLPTEADKEAKLLERFNVQLVTRKYENDNKANGCTAHPEAANGENQICRSQFHSRFLLNVRSV